MNRIIIDYDDTIAICKDRDWANAIPNLEVISKMNSLYDQGWIIDIYTARGSLSCSSREEAELKNRLQIETWLKLHQVKYNQLSFNKPLGTYYVDDKALTPEQFAGLDIEKLQGGWSGSHVERRGNSVFKTDLNSYTTVSWYEQVQHLLNVPRVFKVYGNTLELEYIPSTCKKFDLLKLLSIIETLRHIPLPKSNSVITYIEYIVSKKTEFNPDFALDIIYHEDPIATFAHGDFSFSNIINNNGKYFLIDPSYKPAIWSSYLLDISKLAISCRINGISVDPIYRKYYKHSRLLFALEITHIIRIFNDCPSEEIKDCLRRTFNLLKGLLS